MGTMIRRDNRPLVRRLAGIGSGIGLRNCTHGRNLDCASGLLPGSSIVFKVAGRVRSLRGTSS